MPFGTENLKWCGYLKVRKIRFDRMYERDEQSDRRTDRRTDTA